MSVAVNIQQIYYRPEQREFLDPAFTPYFNDSHGEEVYRWREFSVFLQAWREKRHYHSDYLGYVSWKFGEKSRLQGQVFADWIRENSGYDVYSLNPFPVQSLGFRNVWQQAMNYHEGIEPLLEFLFQSKILPGDIMTDVHGPEETLYCNYWVGNAFFWDQFLPWAEKVKVFLETKLAPELHSLAFHRIDQTHQSPYSAFVMERLFTAFVCQNGRIRHLAFKYSESQLADRYGAFVSSRFAKLERIKQRERANMELLAGHRRFRRRVLDEAYREITPFRRVLRRRFGTWCRRLLRIVGFQCR
jgi:hypothetical protein